MKEGQGHKHTHKPGHVAKAIAAALGVLGFFNLVWMALAWALVAWLGLPRDLGSVLGRGALVFSLGLILSGLVISILGRLIGRRTSDFFDTMIQAIRRIGRGDFSVRVAWDESYRDGPFRSVVERFNEMTESLERMEELRQEFVSDVSHEIQSPLTSIRGFALALRDPALPRDRAEHYLGIIEAESGRLSRLADSLLSLNALESQQPVRTEFRLDQQLRDCLLAAEPLWRAKDLEVDFEAPALSVRADSLMLSQVWTNLIGNAIKFTPTGGAIRLTARREAGPPESGVVDCLVVEVTDSGIGLNPEQCLRVFDRFYKADASRNSSAGGSGLGLAIARKALDLHGGSIEAVSEGPGRGTRFTVRLPDSPQGGAIGTA